MSAQAQWVALLRGINVGGANRLAMADLRALAVSLGWRDPKTYIASGNLVFAAAGTAAALARSLGTALAERHGLKASVLVLPARRLAETLAACPFAPEDPRHAHLFFLMGKPVFDPNLYDELKSDSEQLTLARHVAYLHAPDGIGRSRLAPAIERVLGCPATGRNLRTAREIAALLA